MPQTCKQCSPTQHFHEDHSYQSYIIENDKQEDVTLHVYSCKICPCKIEMEGGDAEDFRKEVNKLYAKIV